VQLRCPVCHVDRPGWAFLPHPGGACAQCRGHHYSMQDVVTLLAREREALAALCDRSAAHAARPARGESCAADFEVWLAAWREGWADAARSLSAAVRLGTIDTRPREGG
jgi:hypothetical protein